MVVAFSYFENEHTLKDKEVTHTKAYTLNFEGAEVSPFSKSYVLKFLNVRN